VNEEPTEREPATPSQIAKARRERAERILDAIRQRRNRERRTA
jgi:hypothetical protein